MDIQLIVLWALVGWCGTPPGPRPWPPIPDPDPFPWIVKGVGIIGAVVGGIIFSQVWQTAGGVVVTDGMPAINAAATSVGAYVGAVLLGDIYGVVRK